MPNLNGRSTPIELAPGYRIIAPGLTGSVTTHSGRSPGIRGGPEIATEAFDTALEATGMNEIMSVELDVQNVPVPAAEPSIRTIHNEDGLVLEVPDLGDTAGQIVLAIDEDGVVTWNFPVDQQSRIETPTTRGAGGSKRFLIRRNAVPASPTTESSKRGLVGILGRKILKVLVFKVTDPILGPISANFARKWEEKKRAYLVRSFSPQDFLNKETEAFNLQDWQRIAAGRSLLFVHGTTSTCSDGFAHFKPNELENLYQAYDGRIFGFNHFTLSENPEENAAWFESQIPDDLSLDLDIIAHSRGGLVARTIAGELKSIAGVNVRHIVFVGVPNHGTLLADPDNLVAFIDRYTTILNLAPPGPLSVVADILEGIIIVAKIISHAVLNGIPGLTVMNPSSEFLKRLNRPDNQKSTRYHAITSDFEPKGSLKELVKQVIQDQVMDRIFKNDPNDLMVPTKGVYQGSQSPGFPVPDARVLTFTASRGVGHSDYFLYDETYTKLKEWLLTGD